MKYTGTLTYSKISTFNRCRKLFHDQYIKMAGFVRSHALERGSKIHEWIAEMLVNPALPEASVDLSEESIRFVLNQVKDIKSDAKRMYVETNFALSHDLVTLVPYNSDSFLRGTFDLVVEKSDGNISLIDWKSGESKPDDMQLQIYTWVLKKVYPLKTIQSQYVCVDKRKVIEVEDRDIEDEIERVRDEVYKEDEWKPETGWYCSFCPYVTYRYEQEGKEISEAAYKRLKKCKESVQKIEVSRPKECGSSERTESVEVDINDFLKTIS